MRKLLCAVAAASFPTQALAAILNVPASFPTIQAAVNASAPGDTVMIAPGTYTGTGNRDINPLGKAITITSSGGAAVTIIDCQGAAATLRRGFAMTSGGSGLIIENLTIRNAYHTTAAGIRAINASPTLRGLIIEDCTATTGGGGGIELSGNSAAVLQDIIIRRCTASFGGGISDPSSGTVTYTNCTVTACTAATKGGGINVVGSPATFTNLTLGENSAPQGGAGLYVNSNSTVSISGSVIENNTCPNAWGGGILSDGVNSSINIAQTIVRANTAFRGAGAWSSQPFTVTDSQFIANIAGEYGGALVFDTGAVVSLTDVLMQNNQSLNSAGAIWSFAGSLTATRVIVQGNTATDYNGGLRLEGATSTLIDCTVAGNSAGVEGGGIGMFAGTASLDGCLITGNTSAYSGGIHVGGTTQSVSLIDTDITLNTCTFGEAGGLSLRDSALLTMNGGSISNNSAPNSGGAGVVLNLTGNTPGAYTFTGVSISGNTSLGYGAGILQFNGPATFSSCQITNNTSSSEGGGALLFDTAVFNGCLIQGNTAYNGGGVSCIGGADLVLVDSTVIQNTTTVQQGGGIYARDAASLSITGGAVSYNNAATSGGGIFVAVNGSFPTNHSMTNVTIEGNSCGGNGAGLDWGGLNAAMTAQNCRFISNVADQAGGGLNVWQGNPSFIDCEFSTNFAAGYAGAILLGGSNSPSLTRCIISSNATDGNGGGITTADGVQATITDCMISQNLANAAGGIWLHGHSSTATITGTTIDQNTATSGVGGVLTSWNSQNSLTRSSVSRNSGSEGGIFAVDDSRLTIDTCRIWGNAGTSLGGGLRVQYGPVVNVLNSLFHANTSAFVAGVLVYATNERPTTVNLTNCTVAGHASTPGVYYDAAAGLIANSVIGGNLPAPLTGGPASLAVTYSSIQGGFAGTGNISTPPIFTDANGANNILGDADDDYSLTLASSGLDAGNNTLLSGSVTLDLAGRPRRVDLICVADTGVGPAPVVDMGAFETPPPAPCPGDLNCDRSVNTADLVTFLGTFGQTVAPGSTGDLNGDGVVNTADLVAFLGVFGTLCP